MVGRGPRRGAFNIARGDVWLAGLDPTVGSEIQKTRPCLIVSPPEMNDRLRTVLAAPLTSAANPLPPAFLWSFKIEWALSCSTNSAHSISPG
jgi:mRNA interferase MazF